MQLPGLQVNNKNYLYTHNCTYVDFNIDENGILSLCTFFFFLILYVKYEMHIIE